MQGYWDVKTSGDTTESYITQLLKPMKSPLNATEYLLQQGMEKNGPEIDFLRKTSSTPLFTVRESVPKKKVRSNEFRYFKTTLRIKLMGEYAKQH